MVMVFCNMLVCNLVGKWCNHIVAQLTMRWHYCCQHENLRVRV